MRRNFVLVDYENVRPQTLDLLAPECFHVRLFVGANQSKLPFEIVESMQKLGMRAEYIKVSGSGSNSLDFHIAYYVGVLAAEDPVACFHIVSRDTGFDPLVQHLKGKKRCIRRVNAIDDIPIKTTAAHSPAARAHLFAEKLAQPKVTKPRTRTTLSRSIASFFQHKLSEEEVAGVVAGLIERRKIALEGDKIVYLGPASG
jgi:hypothetical protein